MRIGRGSCYQPLEKRMVSGTEFFFLLTLATISFSLFWQTWMDPIEPTINLMCGVMGKCGTQSLTSPNWSFDSGTDYLGHTPYSLGLYFLSWGRQWDFDEIMFVKHLAYFIVHHTYIFRLSRVAPPSPIPMLKSEPPQPSLNIWRKGL